MALSLSREAIINLRPPKYSGLPQLPAPALTWFTVRPAWHITYSTSLRRSSQRNARIRFELSKDEKSFKTTHSHQQVNSPAIESADTVLNPVDVKDGRAYLFEEEGSGRAWEILAWGKEGQLEDWMIDQGDGWIADSSGEVRGDWRNSYVVVMVSGEDEKAEPAVEIWDRFGTLTDGTIEKIRVALGGVNDEKFGLLVDSLDQIKMDSGRDADDEEARKHY